MPTKISLISPLDGVIVPLEKVPDPVFSQHMLGNGMAIMPTSQTVFAPLEGIVTNINSACHALVITHGKLEVLIHVGIESVSLKGEGFQTFVKQGETVKAGQKLVSFNLDILTIKRESNEKIYTHNHLFIFLSLKPVGTNADGSRNCLSEE